MPEPPSGSPLRIAAVADIHHGQPDASTVPLLTRGLEGVDVLLICGDLTHHGLAEEAADLAKQLSVLHIPILAVLGNHDYHANQQEEIKRVLRDSPIRVLDGDACEIKGVGFAGVKGFATGFGKRVLEPWGEEIVKAFVREAVEEAVKLGSALSLLHNERTIALLHYAPIAETCEGEPPEIHAFLGSSRLEEPLNRHQVSAAFHGHAHHGRPEGRTGTGIPVYNVSLPLLRRTQPDSLPFRIYELDGDVTPRRTDGG
ncbi:MAG TPA: metallophosphoesterase [Candidatus Polarisedimenticolia bacterium]|nr:metallophosphoesterase [Candidatus Polarisedimenticolia bacterium]